MNGKLSIVSPELKKFISSLLALASIFWFYAITLYLYAWYLGPHESFILHTDVNLTVFLVIILWVLYPSTILVSIVSLTGSVAPAFMLPLNGLESFNVTRCGVIIFSVLILAGVTKLLKKNEVFKFRDSLHK